MWLHWVVSSATVVVDTVKTYLSKLPFLPAGESPSLYIIFCNVNSAENSACFDFVNHVFPILPVSFLFLSV